MSKKGYDQSRVQVGHEILSVLACAHGGVDGSFEDVPADRRAQFADKLSSIMSGGAMSAAHVKTLVHGEPAPKPKRAAAYDPFESIRAKVYHRPADDDADEP